jgi:hypothetical protein
LNRYIAGAKLSPPRPCIVYSFGVRGESSFEAEMHDRTPCDIFAFDMTVDGMAGAAQGKPRIQFMKKGLGARTGGDLMSLRDIMAHYGHTLIDVLKVDIEGAEMDVFPAILADFPGDVPFEQLMLELHHEEGAKLKTFELFHKLEARGVVPFSSETNYNPCVQGRQATAIEYSFYTTRWWFDEGRWYDYM